MAGNVNQLVDKGLYYEMLAADGKTYRINKDIDAGTYTPELTNTANITSSSAFPCQWMRIKTVVTVSGAVNVDPTTTLTQTILGISLPIASDFTANEQCCGAAASTQVAEQSAAIIADATNNRARMVWIAVDTVDWPMYFTFTYQII